MITTAVLVQIVFGIAFLFAAAIASYIALRVAVSLFRKAKDSGVTLTDGLQSSEVSVLKKLLKEELDEEAEMESLKKIKRALDRAVSKGKVI